MTEQLQQRIVELEAEVDDLQEQLEAQDKIPDMRDWERLLERLSQKERMCNCLADAVLHAQKQLQEMTADRDEANREIASYKMREKGLVFDLIKAENLKEKDNS
jgi:cell division protein FtsB